MKRKRICFFIVLIIVFIFDGLSVAFQNEPDGFQGKKWESDLSTDTENFVLLGKNNISKEFFFAPKKDKISLVAGGNSVTSKNAKFTCYENHFIKVDLHFAAETFSKVKEILEITYGNPNWKSRKTFKWNGDTTCIRLKTTERDLEHSKDYVLIFYSKAFYFWGNKFFKDSGIKDKSYKNEPDGFQGKKWESDLSTDTDNFELKHSNPKGFLTLKDGKPIWTARNLYVRKPDEAMLFSNKKSVAAKECKYFCYGNDLYGGVLIFSRSAFDQVCEIIFDLYGEPTKYYKKNDRWEWSGKVTKLNLSRHPPDSLTDDKSVSVAFKDAKSLKKIESAEKQRKNYLRQQAVENMTDQQKKKAELRKQEQKQRQIERDIQRQKKREEMLKKKNETGGF